MRRRRTIICIVFLLLVACVVLYVASRPHFLLWQTEWWQEFAYVRRTHHTVKMDMRYQVENDEARGIYEIWEYDAKFAAAPGPNQFWHVTYEIPEVPKTWQEAHAVYQSTDRQAMSDAIYERMRGELREIVEAARSHRQ